MKSVGSIWFSLIYFDFLCILTEINWFPFIPFNFHWLSLNPYGIWLDFMGMIFISFSKKSTTFIDFYWFSMLWLLFVFLSSVLDFIKDVLKINRSQWKSIDIIGNALEPNRNQWESIGFWTNIQANNRSQQLRMTTIQIDEDPIQA